MLSSLGPAALANADSSSLRSRSSNQRVLTGFMDSNDQQAPIEGGGGAPGAKSYNSRSGQIFGMLKQMLGTFEKDLGASQKEELLAQINYHNLRAAKEHQIHAAQTSIDEKTLDLGETGDKLAQAKQDLEDTKAQLAADQEFLINLKKQCDTAAKEYAERQKTRQDEIKVIGEVIAMLTSDDAKDLFSSAV